MRKLLLNVSVATLTPANSKKVTSAVVVSLGGLAIATATLGGKYTPARATKEFRLNTKRFKPQNNYTHEKLKELIPFLPT